VARAQWGVAQAGLKTAGGRPNPVLSLTPGYDTTTAIPSPWLPAVNFDLPLETMGKRAKRMAEADAVAQSARWALITTAWQVRGTVRDALLDWELAGGRRTLLDRQLTLQEQATRRWQQRLEAGEIARAELLPARIALQKIRADELDAQAKSSDAYARLAGTIGLSTAALKGVVIKADFSTNVPPPLATAAARHLALVSRSDILGSLSDYAAAEDDLRLEIAKQYPDVHVNPGYQFDQGDSKWTLGITFELPILNQNQGPIAEAEARRKLAAAKFMALQAQVINDLDRAMAGCELAEKQWRAGVALQASAQEQTAALQAQLKAGAADQMDLLGVELDQLMADQSQLEILNLSQRAQAALEDALQRPLDASLQTALQQMGEPPKGKESQP
jgi:cobalt-zinc-cadmium efflux system outer membrane protein